MLPSLPLGARKVGSGDLPVGELAKSGGFGLSGFGDIELGNPWTWAAAAVVAVAVYSWWKSR
jgi:hypothetical protein